MLEALFPRQIPTVLLSSDHPTQRLAPAAQPRPAQPAAHSNGKFSIFTASLWMGTDTELSKLPSVCCCRWPGHKTSHEECREYFFQSGSFNYFLAGTALLRPLHTRCDRRVRDVWRCSRWRVYYIHLVVFFTAIISIDRVAWTFFDFLLYIPNNVKHRLQICAGIVLHYIEPMEGVMVIICNMF